LKTVVMLALHNLTKDPRGIDTYIAHGALL